jgi:hypothetical protein
MNPQRHRPNGVVNHALQLRYRFYKPESGISFGDHLLVGGASQSHHNLLELPDISKHPAISNSTAIENILVASIPG